MQGTANEQGRGRMSGAVQRRHVVLAAVAGAAIALTTAILARYSDFMDLAVYEWAGRTIFDEAKLYELVDPVTGLRFTYTPFAGLLFALAEPVKLLTPVAFTALSLVALGRVAVLLARSASSLLPCWSVRQRALLLGSLTLLAEPTVETLRLGQVDLLIAWLVVEDLLGPRRRWSGLLVGIATAIKLTPAIFVVLLLVVGRTRAAGAAILAFAVAAVVGFLALPDESRDFWGRAVFEADRVGNVEFLGNQSLNGVLWRLLGEGGSRVVWALLVTGIVAASLWLARSWWRAGHPTLAVGLTALAGLCASPISWTHHWVLFLPMLVGLLAAAPDHRWVRGVVAAAYVVFASRLVWRAPQDDGREFDLNVLQQLIASSYLLVALALLAAAWALRPSARRSPSASPR